MPICVECGHAVTALFTEYSKGNIRLTQCQRCKKFADKYVEFDFVILFTDMILHRPQVYRHILFNRLEYIDKGMDPQVLRFGILLTLFDVYIKWFRMEMVHGHSIFAAQDLHLLVQYFYILSICVLEAFIVHFTIRWCVWLVLGFKYAIVKYNYISSALIISSFPKLLFILMIIWDYDELEFSWLVNLLVLTSNAEALSALLNLGYGAAFLTLGLGLVAKTVFQLSIVSFNPSMKIDIFTSF